MEATVKAILTNEEGWQKQFKFEDGVFLAGSAEEAQIRLPAEDSIEPYHLQIVNNSRETHVRLINLSKSEMCLEKGAQELPFPSGSFRDVFGGEIVHLGAYTIEFEIHKQYIPKEVTQEENQKVIGLRMALSSQVLHPDEVVTGTLYLRNLGTEACQFDVTLTGLPRECYEIDPIPFINAGGEESTSIRFYHRRSAPPAGNVTFHLRVCAPTVYPGRELDVHQTLKVYPSYQHRLAWPGEAPETEAAPTVQPTPPVPAAEEATPKSVPATAAEPIPSAEPGSPAAQAPAEPAAEAEVQPVPETPESAASEELEPEVELAYGPLPANPAPKSKRPDLSGVKVLRVSSGEFLEEKGKKH